MYLCELNYKQIRKHVDPKTRERSLTQLATEYAGIDKKGNIIFKTPSGTHPRSDGIVWTQKVKLLDLPKIAKRKGLSDIEKVRKAIQGNLKVTCDCPAHLYWGSAWRLDKRDAELELLGVEAPRHNTVIPSWCCKHLFNVMGVLPFNASKITRDMKKRGMLKA